MIPGRAAARRRSGALRIGAAIYAAALCSIAAGAGGVAHAQYAGSNVTGSQGLIAIDKVGDKIRFYDPLTLTLLKTLDPPGEGVHELAISYDHRTAFVPLYGLGIYGSNPKPNNKILAIDLASQSVSAVIDLGQYHAPHGMVATRDGKLWVVCDQQDKLLLIDPATKSIEAAYDSPGKGPHFVVALPDETRLYISNKQGPVGVFDTRKREFLTSIPLAAAAADPAAITAVVGSEGITPTPDGRRILTVDNDRGDLRVIDTATNRQVERIPLAMMPLTNSKRSRLLKLMFSPNGKYLVVTGYATGLAWVIDPTDYRRQTVISVAKGPQGIAFPPDGKSVIVSSHDDGLLTRIDLARKAAVSQADGGGGIEVLAFY